MGAEDQLKEGEWRWVSDQSKVQYSGWSNGEPNNYGGNEDCVLFYLPCNFNWNDGRCHFLSGYICEKQNVRIIKAFFLFDMSNPTEDIWTVDMMLIIRPKLPSAIC